MFAGRQHIRARLFYAVVVAGLVLWIVVTGQYMSHVVNLWTVIPVVTVIVAFVVPPAPVYTLLATLGVHILNLCFFDLAEPSNDVSRSGGWTLIVAAIVGNSALVGVVAWRMRATRLTIADRKAGRQGLLLKAMGATLWLISTFAALVLWLEPPSHDADIHYILIFGLPILGGYLWYRGRQYDAIARSKVFENDRRPPVLYLRSFARDESVWQASLSFLFNPRLLPRGRGEEEQLADAVSPIGPLLALGKPGEGLPTRGAHRIYVSHQEWRPRVESLMQEAQLVIIRVEIGGEGLWWEVERAVEMVAPGRLLLLFMLSAKQQHKALKEIGNRAGLDSFRGSESAMHAFLWCRPDGGTQILKLKAPYWRTPAFKWLKSRARYALRPIFQTYGFEWTAPSISLSRIAITVPGVLVILFMIVLWITTR